jgi:hypothetical protein
MPATAAGHALDDPFDGYRAIPAAASYLANLRKRFGSLGLAAAAYNAGPRRVSDWLAGIGPLPAETVAYVRAVTGREAIDWVDPGRKSFITNQPALKAIPQTSFGNTFRTKSKLSPEAALCASLAETGKNCIIKDAY